MTRLNVKLLIILAISIVVLTTGVVVVHGIQMGSSIDSLLRRAEKAKQDNPQTAIRLYQLYHSHKPDDVEHYADYAMFAAEVALKPGATNRDIGTAIRELEQVLRGTVPENREPELRRKLIELDMSPYVGRYAEAKEHLLILKKKGQSDTDADLKLARCHILTGHYPEGRDLLYAQIGYEPKTKSFDITKATAPKELGAYAMLIQVLRDRITNAQMLDREEVADLVLEQIVKANPDSGKAYLTQAQFLKDRDSAKPAIEKALDLSPEDPDVLAQAVEVASSNKEFNRAEELLTKAIKLHPKDERFYLYSVLIGDFQKKPELAKERLAAGLTELPNAAGLLSMQFDRQIQDHDLDGAKVTLKRLSNTRIPPVNRGFLEAKLLVAQGDMKTASQRLEGLVQQAARNPALSRQINSVLMECYNALGQRDRAQDRAAQVPGSLAAEVIKASGLAAAGKTREALDIFEQIAKALEEQNQLAAVPQVASSVLQLRIAEQVAKPKEARNWQAVDSWFAKMRDLGSMKPPTDSLVEAEILFRKGETERASELLKELQSKYPKDSAIAALQVGMLLQSGKSEEALKFIEGAPADLRNSPALIGAKIEAQFVMGRPTDEVKSSLTKISEEVSEMPAEVQARVHTALGGAYLRLSDRAAAEFELKKAGELQPSDARVRWMLFDIARQSGDVPALESLRDWFVKEFGREDAQSKLADAAIIVVKVRESLRTKYTDRPDQLALSNDDQQNLTKARDLLREVNNARPGWVEHPRLLAEINVLENRYDDAITNLQDVLANGQVSTQTVRQLVMLLHQRRRDSEASQLIAKYSTLFTGDDMKQLRDQIAILGGADKDEVLRRFEAEYDKDSQDPARHLYAGRLFSTAGKPDLAEAAFRRAVELGPSNPETWLTLINQLVLSKKSEEVLKVVQDAQIKLPEDRRNAVLAQGYEAVGDQTQAQTYYLAALEAAPNDLGVQRTVASYYLRTNRRAEAEKQLDQMIKATGSSPADREHVAWARRTTAQLLASDGDYRNFQKAQELLTPQGRKPTAEDLSTRIALLFDRTDPTSTRQALRLLTELKQIRPLTVQERLGLAKLHERLGDWLSARDEMNTLLAGANPDPLARLTYVEMLLRRGEVDEAQSHMQSLGNVNQQYAPQMAMLTAKILKARNRGAEAGALLTRLLPAERPLAAAQVPLLLAISGALEEIEQFDQAEKFLREYVSQEPNQMLRLAAFLARRGKIDAALDLAERYRGAFPTPQLLSIAMTALRQNEKPPTPEQVARAEQWITSSAQEEPESFQVQLVLADLRDFQRNFAEAEKVYRGILSRTDTPAQSRAEVMNNLAFLLAMQGRDVEEALKLINDAISIYGPQSDMLDTRGVVSLMKGDTKQAIADLSDAVLATDPRPIKYVHLAMAQAAAKDLAGARRSLEKAKSLKFNRDDLSPLEKSKFEELLKQLNMTV